MSKARILIVDDNVEARVGLENYLVAKEFSVTTVESGEEAVTLLKEKEPFNIVLTDLKIKNIDGLVVLAETLKLHPYSDVIIMTAHASVDSAVEVMKAGAYDYVSKPLNMEEIVVLLERCLEKQRLAKELSGLKQIVNLYEISQKMSVIMDLGELLNIIINLAADALAADGGSIMLYDSENNELEVKAADGTFKEQVIGKIFKVGDRFAGRAAEFKKPILSEEVRQEEWFKTMEQFEDIKSGMSVPMIIKEKLIGTVNLKRTSRNKKFSERDIKLLSVFAQQAAVAIENSYLFRDLTKEKDKLSSLFSNMGDGAVMVNKKYEISVINKTAKIFCDLGKKDYSGVPFKDILNGFLSSKPWNKLKNSDNKNESFELAREGANPIYLSVIASRIKDKEGEVVNTIFVLRNITDQKKEAMRKKSFLRLMSHKLRTPLTSIIGFVDILGEKENFSYLNEKSRKAVGVIEKETRHLSSLVDKLLRFTLLETESIKLNLENTSVDALVERALDSMDSFLKEKKVEVSVEGLEQEEDLKFEGDSEKLQESVENLIENAVKFNDNKNKEVYIKGKVEEEDYVSLSVGDNGPGIPDHKHEFIFEKFQQLENYFTGQVEGMGLGLALVKKIVKVHQGRVEVESSQGEGSTFKIILPKTQE